MAEESQKQERKVINYYSRGQLFAFIFALSSLLLTGYLALEDKQIAASVLGASTILGIVTAFINGKKA